MVVFLDFEDDSPDPFLEPYRPTDAYPLPQQQQQQQQQYHGGQPDGEPAQSSHGDERPNPNINGFSAILSCYPIVSQLASLLDLNTLHNLSRTCRQFRANLLEYRNQLVTQTLRCCNDEVPEEQPSPSSPHDAQHDWRSAPEGRRLLSGKVGKCARDMVGECRKCGVVVCRNCTSKPPPPIAFPQRLRRLCKTCANAPLPILTAPDITTPPPAGSLLSYRARSTGSTPGSSPHGSTSTLSSTPPSTSPPLFTLSSSPGAASSCGPPSPGKDIEHNNDDDEKPAFTCQAFIRSPCTCPEVVWLCQPCGHGIRTKDQQYSLGWTWRTRYSTYLGGLGAGIGEGLEGVKCGLESACRGGHDVEHEECGTAEELADIQRQLSGHGAMQTSHGISIGGGGGSSNSSSNSNAFGGTGGTAVGSPHDEWSGTSFFAQEIEGIGGRRVMKVKRRVRVGAVVKEYEDERERREPYLTREKEGANRAWCAWCARVVPSKRDARELEKWGFEGLYCGDGRTARV
ncbi:hypothetical protein B0J12DRAFT_655094 [Macrophomina phaseolina]|uniref:Zinc finger FYVE/PHD-type protein n=1 Tax=Macrophomina phaseolina TaxID=35725 RepID=A0ABQ8GGM0_9PEZI|nr:hypothetical protein B0J12DRAFT_655094 [Macrophomina phaseolina]